MEENNNNDILEKVTITVSPEMIIEMQERVDELEKETKMLAQFCKMQASINNVMRFLVCKKYTEKELNDALEEFKKIEKEILPHKSENKNSEKSEENSEN